MAILNNLVVNGAGRILNKLYCNDLVTDKITSATGTSYISLYGGTGNYFFGGSGIQLGKFSGGYVGSNYERDYTLGVRSGTVGANSFVLGISCEASAVASISMGVSSVASANYSIAMGYTNISSGTASVALGDSNQATRPYSFCAGMMNIASNSSAVAVGSYNTASGGYSISAGYYNTASATNSVAIGQYTVAANANNTVIGKYNKATVSGSGSSAIYSNVGDYAFTIGNGTANTTAGRSNALTVDWSGNMILSGSLTCTNVHPVYHHTVTSASDVCTITHNLNISGTYYPLVQVCSANSALFVYGVRNCTANSFQVLLGCIDGYNPQTSNGKSVTLAWTY